MPDVIIEDQGDPRNVYVANPGQTQFDYTFPIFDASHLQVLVDNAEVSQAEYDVAGVLDQEGGSITFHDGLDGDEIVVVQLSRPIDRLTDFQTAGDFFAREVNRQFDAQVQFEQQLRREIRRSLRLPDGDPTPGSAFILPDLDERRNFRFLGFDEDGLPVARDIADFSGISIGDADDEVPLNANLNARGFAPSVASVADLRASSFPESVQRLWLSGLNGVGTEGGGHYRADRDDESSSDDGDSVIIDVDGVRWKRESRNILEPVGEQEAHDEPEGQAALARLDRLYTAGLILGIGSSATITVGDGGDFSNIGDAVRYFSRRWKFFVQSGVAMEIRLLSGFVMQEQLLLVCAGDLSGIRITSDDAVVTINRESLTIGQGESLEGTGVPIADPGAFPAFSAVTSSLPTIGVLFEMDSTGTATDRFGISLRFRGQVTVEPGCGITDVPGRGLEVQQGSFANAVEGVFDNCGIGIRCGNSSQLHASGVSAQNCGVGLAIGHSRAGINGANVSGATGTGAQGIGLRNDTSLIAAVNLTANNCQNIAAQLRFTGKTDLTGFSSDLCGEGIDITGASEACVNNGEITNPTTIGIRANASRVLFSGGTISGSGGNGITSRDLAHVAARNASVTGSSGDDLVVVGGGQIQITGGETSSGGGSPDTNDTNVLSFNAIDGSNGIIWN